MYVCVGGGEGGGGVIRGTYDPPLANEDDPVLLPTAGVQPTAGDGGTGCSSG